MDLSSGLVSSAGVGASLLRYEMFARAHGPNLELLPGGGAERVGSGEADGVSLTHEAPSEFPAHSKFGFGEHEFVDRVGIVCDVEPGPGADFDDAPVRFSQ